jgi:hypothetical protein
MTAFLRNTVTLCSPTCCLAVVTAQLTTCPLLLRYPCNCFDLSLFPPCELITSHVYGRVYTLWSGGESPLVNIDNPNVIILEDSSHQLGFAPYTVLRMQLLDLPYNCRIMKPLLLLSEGITPRPTSCMPSQEISACLTCMLPLILNIHVGS